jgi:hypothetical protein
VETEASSAPLSAFNLKISAGVKIPFSVMMAVINSAGVTSKAGFHTEIPEAQIFSNHYMTQN